MTTDDAQPVLIANLLRFADDGSGYTEYARRFAATGLMETYDGEVIAVGVGSDLVAGSDGYDLVVLARYSSRGHYDRLLADPQYLAIEPIREAALRSSIIQRLVPMHH